MPKSAIGGTTILFFMTFPAADTGEPKSSKPINMLPSVAESNPL